MLEESLRKENAAQGGMKSIFSIVLSRGIDADICSLFGVSLIL